MHLNSASARRSAILLAAVAVLAGAPAASASVGAQGHLTGQSARCAAAPHSAVIASTPACAAALCSRDPLHLSCRPE